MKLLNEDYLWHYFESIFIVLLVPRTFVLYCIVWLCFSRKAENEGGVTLSDRGSVLVFLPGIHEISYMQEALAKLVHKRCAFSQQVSFVLQ